MLFDPTSVPCSCFPSGDGTECVCGGAERVLRYVSGHDKNLTEEQRAWCLTEIDSIEGQPTFLATDSDADIARGVINAWTDYARDKGLL